MSNFHESCRRDVQKPKELKIFEIFAKVVSNIHSRPPRGNSHKFTLESIISPILQTSLERKCFANGGKIFLRSLLYLSLKICLNTIFASIGLVEDWEGKFDSFNIDLTSSSAKT